MLLSTVRCTKYSLRKKKMPNMGSLVGVSSKKLGEQSVSSQCNGPRRINLLCRKGQ